MTTRIDRRSFLGAAALGAAAASRAEKAGTDDDPLGARAEFPLTREQAYLNTAYVGPIPRSVRDAAVEEADLKMMMPTPGNRSDRAESAREKFARLFGAKKEEIALLYSTSDGENVVTAGLDWKPGDNVVLDELHFQTSFVLYRELERTKGIELRIVPQSGGRARIEDYDSRIDGRTRLVSIAWVSNRNGFRQDLNALSKLAHRVVRARTGPKDAGECARTGASHGHAPRGRIPGPGLGRSLQQSERRRAATFRPEGDGVNGVSCFRIEST